MFVKFNFYLAVNPFYDAYAQSDLMGKLIFIGLIALSIASWVIIIQKARLTHQARKFSVQFQEIFSHQRSNPLGIDCDGAVKRKKPNPFFELYTVLKKYTVDILTKNRRFGSSNHNGSEGTYLSPVDLDFIQSHLATAAASQTKFLEKNLFILATVVSLAPFLGLLGTVWGILTTFSELQAQTAGSTHQTVLSGLSLALATTVLGLIDAIPALIGYNYLKNVIRDFEIEMESFSTQILASVEMQYRKVDTQ